MLPCVSLEIGRGHPNYLDSFLKVYPGRTLLIKREWGLLKACYLLGGRGGRLTQIYNALRRKGSLPKLLLSYIAHDLEKELKGNEVVVVSHPLLVKALKDRYKVFYIHGEIAAPKESIVDADVSFVPLQKTKREFVASGIKEKRVLVTGLVIEPELLAVAERSFLARVKRLRDKSKLAVAFFSSGAYPRIHIEKIVKAADSAIKAGVGVLLFSGDNLRIKRFFERRVPKGEVIFTRNRKEENEEVRKVLELIDGFVAPAHERTNWACGLGLPLFCLLPHIGSYAPLNYEFAFKQGVSLPLAAERFGEEILRLREEGKLLEMAEKGFGKLPIDGARKIAEEIRKLLIHTQKTQC